MKTIIVAFTILLASNAMAGTAETWSGSGAEYSPDGTQLSTYQISVVNTQVSANVVQSDATITKPNGQQETISQTLTMNGSEWTDSSNLGQGGGACYGSDTCENYISGSNGMAYATTIISDGPRARRELTMILQNGKAVKVLRENLSRVN